MSIFGWVPPLVILSLAAYTYYAYVVAMCLFTAKSLVEKIILLFFFHLFLVMAFWCFHRSIFAKPFKPSAKFAMDESEWSKISYNYNWKKEKDMTNALREKVGILTTASDTGQGIIQYCFQCRNLKPDRCHHCSRCGVCVLKMDHHCPWVNNCVGFHNYKFFILFLGYTSFNILYVIFTSIHFIIQFFFMVQRLGWMEALNSNEVVIIIMVVLHILMGFTLSPLLYLHLGLICHNVTTLENSRPVGLYGTRPSFTTFDLGYRKNMLEVFGTRRLCWFFPVFTSLGDGMSFPITARK